MDTSSVYLSWSKQCALHAVIWYHGMAEGCVAFLIFWCDTNIRRPYNQNGLFIHWFRVWIDKMWGVRRFLDAFGVVSKTYLWHHQAAVKKKKTNKQHVVHEQWAVMARARARVWIFQNHSRVAVIETHDRYPIKYPFGASFIFRTFMQIGISQHKQINK